MAIHHIHDPSSQLTDEHVSHPLHDIDQNDMSQPSSSFTATPPRKRSHSVLHWMQKALNVKTTDGSHGDSPSRHRSSSIAHYRKPSPSEKSPPVSYPGKKHRRPRAPTIDTIDSTDKKMPPRKKTISDTDEKAQQTRSTTNHDEINNGFLRVSQQTLQRIRDTINYLITKIQQHEETIIKEIENKSRQLGINSTLPSDINLVCTSNIPVKLEEFTLPFTHLDNEVFTEGSIIIANRLADVQTKLISDLLSVIDACQSFGQTMHTLQDFYAHSN
ncbi:unnamed protein product [Rotaria sp. Silwood1]|nr:unnamed protein product [Rotaria sp. Silwood1]